MSASKYVRMGTLAVLALGAILVSATSGLASSGRAVVEIRDDCDPATFNAVLGAGACVGNGETTFQQFIAELTKEKTVGDWEFDPDQLKLDAGKTLVAVNRGGETHTFTEVAAFGGGFVEILNILSGNTTLAPECATRLANGQLAPANNPNINFVGPGATLNLPKTGTFQTGTHQFECCIHPWMRTTVTVEADT